MSVDGDGAGALSGDEGERLVDRGGRRCRMAICSLRAHDVLDLEQQVAAERAAGMEGGEVLLLEAARLEQHHGQRVADGEHGGGAGGGREIERAGFARHVDVDVDFGLARERRFGIAGEGDDARAEALEAGDEPRDFLGLAAVAEDEDEVAVGDHAEVAVRGVDGIEHDAGRAGAGEGRGDLRADRARLADAGDDDLVPGLDDLAHGLDGAGEVFVEAPLHGAERGGFEFDDAPALGDVGLEFGREGRFMASAEGAGTVVNAKHSGEGGDVRASEIGERSGGRATKRGVTTAIGIPLERSDVLSW